MLLRGTVLKKDQDGNGVVRFDEPQAGSEFGVFNPRTENLGSIWRQLEIGTPVEVEAEASRSMLMRVIKIEMK